MKCKICGTEMRTLPMGIGGIVVYPTCQCARIRSKERAKGCPHCNATADHDNPTLNLSLVKRWFRKPYYEMRCDVCGHKWKVEEQ